MFPWIGTEMITSKDHSGRVKTDARRDALHEFAEIRGRHSRITALLVDLVAGRLDENAPIRAQRQREGGLNHDRMSGANGCDTRSAVSQSFAHKGRQRSIHDAGFLGLAAKKASRSAWLAAPSIGPCRVTAIA